MRTLKIMCTLCDMEYCTCNYSIPFFCIISSKQLIKYKKITSSSHTIYRHQIHGCPKSACDIYNNCKIFDNFTINLRQLILLIALLVYITARTMANKVDINEINTLKLYVK